MRPLFEAPYLPGGTSVDPVFGDLALIANVKERTIKGGLLATRKRYVVEQYGEEMNQRVAEALSPKVRDLYLNPPLAFEWYSFEVLMEMDYFITTIAMDGVVSRMKHFGAEICKYDFPLTYRVLFKVGSPGFVLSRFGTAYKAYFRPGRLELPERAKTSGLLRMEGPPMPRYLCEFGVAGWARSAIELAGGTNVSAQHASCQHEGGICEWRVTWQ